MSARHRTDARVTAPLRASRSHHELRPSFRLCALVAVAIVLSLATVVHP